MSAGHEESGLDIGASGARRNQSESICRLTLKSFLQGRTDLILPTNQVAVTGLLVEANQRRGHGQNVVQDTQTGAAGRFLFAVCFLATRGKKILHTGPLNAIQDLERNFQRKNTNTIKRKQNYFESSD